MQKTEGIQKAENEKGFKHFESSPNMENTKTVADSRAETMHLVRQGHLNGTGRLFGGILMQWIDEVAAIVAMRHAGSSCITASVDNLQFIHGAHQGDMVVLIGRVTYVGTSSMEIRVDTYVEGADGMRRVINRAYFTMVALDECERPCRVPRLALISEEERAEWAAGEKRREMRALRRREGF